jgi:hypothetical protein
LTKFSLYALYDNHGGFLKAPATKPLHILHHFICNLGDGDGETDQDPGFKLEVHCGRIYMVKRSLARPKKKDISTFRLRAHVKILCESTRFSNT